MSAEAKEIHEQKWNLMLELKYTVHGHGQQGGKPCPPGFSFMVQNICSTDIVDRGLIVLFLGRFCYFSVFISVASPHGRGLILLFFVFLLYFGLFSVAPPLENFSADALDAVSTIRC